MATFPTEIIAEILSRIPVKSLLRFKSVCKSWCSLIKSPTFIKLHLNETLISNSNLHLLLYYPFLYFSELNSHNIHHQLSFSKLPHPLDPKQVHLLGSCNGVICISDASKTDVFLFNPLTKSRRKIPFIEYPELDPRIEVFGFGFDSKTDDYKVLRIVQGFKVGKVLHEEAKVYSLSTNSWKSVEGIIPFYLFERDCQGVLVNEALHYIVITKKLNPLSNSRGHVIVKFDFRTEGFEFMPYPNYADNDESFVMLTLTELGGSLGLIVSYHVNFIQEFADFWVMKEYGKKESWFRLFSIRTESIKSAMLVKPIVYSKDGRSVLLEIDTLRFGWYDLESKNLQKFTLGNIETSKFVGSLVSLEDKQHFERETLLRKSKKNDPFCGGHWITGFIITIGRDRAKCPLEVMLGWLSFVVFLLMSTLCYSSCIFCRLMVAAPNASS